MLKKFMPLLLLVGLVVAPARAAEKAIDLLDVPVSYTAQFSVTSDKGTYEGTVWHAPGRERRDFATNGGGQTVLLRRDTDSAYLMKPSQRWYVGLSFQAVGALAGGIDTLTVERKRVADETIGGIRATRYKVVGNGPKGSRFDGDAWFSKEGIMVRAAGEVTGPDGRTMQVQTRLSDLKIGPVKEQVFELPAGWLGMDMRSMPPDRVAQAIEAMMGARSTHQ